MRPSSPLLDSVRDQFEDYDQLAKDFTRVFLNNSANVTLNANLFDVSFLVPGQQKQKVRFIGVRAILAVRSRQAHPDILSSWKERERKNKKKLQTVIVLSREKSPICSDSV